MQRAKYEDNTLADAITDNKRGSVHNELAGAIDPTDAP